MDLAAAWKRNRVAVFERSGLQSAIQDGTEDGEERWTNLLELRNHAAEFDELAVPEGIAGSLIEADMRAVRDGARWARGLC